MNTRYLEDDIDEIPRDREIALGAPTILGIFFLLALVCAVFFGFGYSFGRKSSSAAIASNSGSTVEAASIRTTGATKPSAAEATDEAPAPESVETAAAGIPESIPTEQAAAVVAPPAKHTAAALKPAPVHPAPVAVEKHVIPTPVVTPAAHTAVAGPSVPSTVQVAAVSHQEDADVLLNALKRRGYSVAIHHEPQDKLLHIQIGPLASRKDADTMRQRLLADGYKAIIK